MSADSVPAAGSLRERLGGPRAVSWVVYLVAAPYFVLSVPLNESGVLDRSTFAVVLLVSVAGYLVFGAVLWIAARTVLRDRAQSPSAVWLVLLVILVGAEARIGVLVVGLRAAGVENSISTPVRLASGGLIALLIFPALIYAQDSWDRFRAARDELLRRRVDEQQQVVRQSEFADLLRDEVVRSARSELDPALARVQRSLDQIDGGELIDDDAGASIVRAADESSAELRRTSHGLWQDPVPPPGLGLPELIAVMARRGPYSIVLAVVVAAVLGWRFFDRFLPIGQAVAGAGTWLAFAVAVAVVTNATCRRSPSHAPAVFLGSVVVLAAPAVIPLIHSAWLPEQCDLGQWIFALLFAALVMAVWGAPGGIATSRRLQLRELAQSIQSSQVSQLAVDQEVLALRRELSIHLHGTVQSDLAIAVVRLQQAVGDGDDAGARQALSRARTVLQVGTDLGFPSGIDDIRAYLGQLAASWRGICDIDFNVVGEPDDARQGTTIGRIVTEAVKDAVRHGGADHVDVRITINDGVCDIAVTNNGQAVNGQATDPAPTGLGTRMLSEASPGDWQRTADPDGRTRLSATLRPVPPSAADR